MMKQNELRNNPTQRNKKRDDDPPWVDACQPGRSKPSHGLTDFFSIGKWQILLEFVGARNRQLKKIGLFSLKCQSVQQKIILWFFFGKVPVKFPDFLHLFPRLRHLVDAPMAFLVQLQLASVVVEPGWSSAAVRSIVLR